MHALVCCIFNQALYAAAAIAGCHRTHSAHCAYHAGHVIFTLGIAQGLFTAYGSYAPTGTDVYTDSYIVASINMLTEILAGFAVFSMLGNMAEHQTEVAAGNPALRENICLRDCTAFDCAMCRQEDWLESVPQAMRKCCGLYETANVAAETRTLGFAVRHMLLHALKLQV